MSNDQDPKAPQTQSSKAIFEPTKDEYLEYKKDPRLPKFVLKEKLIVDKEISNSLIKETSNLDEEEFLDQIRLFKRDQVNNIRNTYESKPFENREIILTELSNVANSILSAALSYQHARLTERYGIPSYLSSYKQTQEAYLSILQMGKLGARTLNYESDLDLVFIYSNRGETHGKEVIDNNQFFVKLVQKFITSLSVLTSRGRAFEIDTELRPSGNTGALVTSYDHFIDHQMNKADCWERQALMRANPTCLNEEFTQLLANQIDQLTFDRPLPNDFGNHMDRIRQQVLKERCKETVDIMDLKLGLGGIMDLEFGLHFLMLKHGRIHKILRQKSLYQVLRELQSIPILKMDLLNDISEIHNKYRTIESYIHLKKKRSDCKLHRNSEITEEIALALKYPSTQSLLEDLKESREIVLEFYNHMYSK